MSNNMGETAELPVQSIIHRSIDLCYMIIFMELSTRTMFMGVAFAKKIARIEMNTGQSDNARPPYKGDTSNYLSDHWMDMLPNLIQHNLALYAVLIHTATVLTIYVYITIHLHGGARKTKPPKVEVTNYL